MLSKLGSNLYNPKDNPEKNIICNMEAAIDIMWLNHKHVLHIFDT